MRNFDFIKGVPHFEKLHEFCHIAELHQLSDPVKSATFSRIALEHLVKNIYLIRGWEFSDRASLFELVDGEDFKGFVNDERLMAALHYIRKAGNKAAHTGRATRKESFFSLLNLHNFVGSVLMLLEVIETLPRFDKNLLTKESKLYVEPTKDTAPHTEIADEYSHRLQQGVRLHAKQPQYFTEAETRRFYIDLFLNEAGWEVVEQENLPVPQKAGIEIRVEGMPNNRNEGYADYVLYGRDGKPLAVVEAKRTSVDPGVGKQQATLYADALEKQYGLRPVIYYTNGYTTFIIDGLGYPPRHISGFHSMAELELLIQRRGRSHITDLKVNEDIAGRHYQVGAVTAVCSHFNQNHRRALLVMATGTGKTRVSISLVDVLMRNRWIKNVLFLADRTALVNQAKRSFTNLLPEATVTVLNENDPKRDLNARIIFSTYQTMINYIDSEIKEFPIGRFDMIIIDEAHRSVFGKYGAIFHYFDSLLVGLTATPRADVDRSTYHLFGMEEGSPNFSYELDEAVNDGYLVPYKGFIRHSEHINTGIKYDDLGDEEKEQLEKVWLYESAKNILEDPKEYKRDIGGNELFNYIYNDDTIDKVLQDLMDNGLKVQDGERIGKTIIFAYNHMHAVRIVERFNLLYPQYGPNFCALIDNTVNYAQTLIDKLELRDKDPQIAVSVDMLDTGIDVPDLLNLVFFKVVRSKIKFMQMIGRGTRLSENIFGDGKHKTEFYIFDYCNNFEYFNQHPKGVEATTTQSLTQRLFNIKIDIIFELQSFEYQQNEFARQYRLQLIEELHSQVADLNRHRIDVRQRLEYVDKFVLQESWQHLVLGDTLDLKEYISPLLMPAQEDIYAKRFDLLVLIVIISLLSPEVNAAKSKNRIIKIGELLKDKTTIPAVKQKIDIIQEVTTYGFWENLSMDRLEYVRAELRDLMQFLVDEGTKVFTIDIEDTISHGGETPDITVTTTYKQRVMDYLKENLEDNETLQKILRIEKLTQQDILELERIFWNELGTKDDYEKHVGNRFAGGNVAVFIRSIIGVDRELAMQKFTELLTHQPLNAEQQEYIRSIIDYVCQNGDITPSTIIEETPFDSYDWSAVFEDNVAYIPQYVHKLHDAIG